MVGDISLCRLLEEINKRVSLSYDRDHMFGHAYFMDVFTMDDLATCFKKKIIPQLQELFFDDYRKMANVIGRASNPDECAFVKPKQRTAFQDKYDYADVFEIVDDRRVFYNPENYIRIYDDRSEEDKELI